MAWLISLPEIFVAVSAMLLLILGVFRGDSSFTLITRLTTAVLLIAAIIVLGFNSHVYYGFFDHFVHNDMIAILKIITLCGFAAVLLIGYQYMCEENLVRFEYPILVLFMALGSMLLLSSNNFLVFYIALEMQALAAYVLAAIRRDTLISAEAGTKYFILGALASGFILFGISIVYGFSGQIDFGALRGYLFVASQNHMDGIAFGMIFILVGLAFKLSVAPFHMWTPDVYQGAPTSVTALFAMVPKFVILGITARLLFEVFPLLNNIWMPLFWALAVTSMVVGSFGALIQENIKRLLAYSSIANVGFILMILATGAAGSLYAAYLYMLVYMVSTGAAFAIVMTLRRSNLAVREISELSGLSQTHPAYAWMMAIVMFSMSGIPPMAGFIGKLFVFQEVVSEGYLILAIIGVIASVVAAYYYLRIIKVMFFEESVDDVTITHSRARDITLYFSMVFMLCFIFNSSDWVYWFFLNTMRGLLNFL